MYAASSSAYGETPTLPKVETMQPDPISPYGVTKYVGELYAQVFGRVYGLENASLRYFNVFGPRQDPTSQYSGVLSRFMLAVIEGEAAGDIRGRRAVARFHVHGKHRGRNIARLRGERGVRESVQRRNRVCGSR